MSTHPKGAEGWRERDTAKSAQRMRRLRTVGRVALAVGDKINDCAVACLPYKGLRVAEWVAAPGVAMRENAALRYGIVPTLDAAAWADSHRRFDCPRYMECLNAAVAAANESKLGELSWRCPQ